MANLGAGMISLVDVDPEIRVTPQLQTITGERDLFQFSWADKNIKVTPIVVSISGKVASIMEPPVQNRFKAR
jgi:hypothetical protein